MLMPPRRVSLQAELEELTERVTALERRLSALEHSSQVPSSSVALSPAAESTHSPSVGTLATQVQPSLLSLSGIAVLGIAGAYVLRAFAESGVFPPWMAVALGLVYAAAWLAWAARPRGPTNLARYVYVVTAALILVPMLWESTVRFQMLKPPVTAAVLAAFAILATTLAWRANLSAIAWVGTVTPVITAVILMVATRMFVPFVLSLLTIALLSELFAIRGRWLGLRPVVAAAADFSVLILVLILGSSSAVPADYRPVAASVMMATVAALFAIYTISISIRSLALRRTVRAFEAAQLVALLLLASWSVLRITSGSGRFLLGMCLLAIGTACYIAAFGVLARHRERPNFPFYAVCAVSLVMAGSFFALPSLPLVGWLCLAAVASTIVGVRARSPALDLHGVAYLSGAVVASGLLTYAGRALAGTYPSAPGQLQVVAAAAAVVCAVMISRYPGEHAGERLLRLLPAVLTVYATAALAVVALLWMVTRGMKPTFPQVAVVRTVVTCAAALLLAFVGARWKRAELVWMAYAAAVLGSLKLAFEDLRVGTTESLAISLLTYGAVLILLPRFVRARRRPASLP
jgi:hypothetical protein